jgi:uncharacterized membrane protein
LDVRRWCGALSQFTLVREKLIFFGRNKTMKKNWLLCIAALGSALLLLVGRSAAQSFYFYPINFPGAVSTAAEGINPGGAVVGLYVDSQGKQHGFLLSRGYFSIDYAGAMATDARGISPGGDIVGSYTNAPGGPPNVHGYLLSQGAFTEVQYPGYLGTIAQRITPTGDIYGCNHNTDFTTSMHGFVRTAAGYTQLDVPASMSNGATPDGRIVVGLYTDLSTRLTHGYFVRSGNFEPFDVPGSTLTQAYDMNPGGVVVGNFRDTAGTQHGFRLSAGGFTTIDYPGATGTQARGINPGGDIVGFYVDSSGKTHGFLAVPTLEQD